MQTCEPTNILIVRLSAIGDIVMASGLITSLRQRFPKAKISWLSEPVGANLLMANQQLEEVIIWPKNDWKDLLQQQGLLTLLQSIRKYRQHLRSRQFDLVVDAQGLLKSSVLGWFTGATRRVGLNNKEGSQVFVTESVKTDYSTMMSSEYRALANYLVAGEADFSLAVEADEQASLAAKKHVRGKVGESDYLVFCPFTTRAQKHWPFDHWIELTRLVITRLKLPAIILGGPQDSADGLEMVNGTDGLHSLVGQTPLLQSSEVIREAKALIGVDTGLTHIGTAHGIPTVAIFGSTLPYSVTDQNTTSVLSLQMPCSPCRRSPTCAGAFPCMANISPSMVFERLTNLLR